MAGRKPEFGSGPLFKAAGTVYGVMIGSALLVLANLPVVLMPLLVAVLGPWALVGFVLLGPSVVASCYAFNRLLAGGDNGVFRDFLSSYQLNFMQALLVWLPYMLFLGVIAFNLSVLPGSPDAASGFGMQLAARIGLVGLALLVCTGAMNAMLILARFSFRTRDIYRLSLYAVGAEKRVSLGTAGILFVTAFILGMTTVWLMLFTAGLVLYLVCLNSRPLLTFVEARFT